MLNSSTLQETNNDLTATPKSSSTSSTLPNVRGLSLLEEFNSPPLPESSGSELDSTIYTDALASSTVNQILTPTSFERESVFSAPLPVDRPPVAPPNAPNKKAKGAKAKSSLGKFKKKDVKKPKLPYSRSEGDDSSDAEMKQVGSRLLPIYKYYEEIFGRKKNKMC